MISKPTSSLREFLKIENPKLLLFCGGAALGTVLTMSSRLLNNTPISVAFGFLCFGCGIILVQSLELRKRRNAAAEMFDQWMKLKLDAF